MISEAEDVTGFMTEVPEGPKEALNKLRELCKQSLTGYEESMTYLGDTACKVPAAAEYINKALEKGATGNKKKTARC